jgi:hypothetical protein
MQWPDYLPWRDKFAEAMDPELFTIDWLDQHVASGGARLWTSEKAAILAEIRHYPTGLRAIHGLYAVGDLREIVEILIPQAEEFGKSQGCTRAFIDSRGAWKRILRDRGYEEYKLMVRKEV